MEYKTDTLEYDIWFRSLWEWCTELLLDKVLITEFSWNAEQLFKYNGVIFERFLDEPWTADAWWDIQVCSIIVLYATNNLILHVCPESIAEISIPVLYNNVRR